MHSPEPAVLPTLSLVRVKRTLACQRRDGVTCKHWGVECKAAVHPTPTLF